jgi:ribosomal protein S18 acetylase RimI-like enzyme
MAVIREATDADLASICSLGEEVNAIHHEAFPAIFAGAGLPNRDRAHWGSSIGKTDSACFVAAADNAVVGFVTVAAIDENHSLLQSGRFGRIGSVGVTESMRGRGIGKALMRQAEAWAADRGATELRLTVWAFNEPALALYRELGYDVRSHQLAKVLTSHAG